MTLRLTVLAASALLAIPRPTSDLALGRYRGALTTPVRPQYKGTVPSSRQLGGRAFYHACNGFLLISFKDTLTRNLSMDFMTRVSPLRLGVYRSRPGVRLGITSAFPAAGDTALSGFFQFFAKDWGYFPDSGSLRLTRLVGNELDGTFSYAGGGVTLTGAFRAMRRGCSVP